MTPNFIAIATDRDRGGRDVLGNCSRRRQRRRAGLNLGVPLGNFTATAGSWRRRR